MPTATGNAEMPISSIATAIKAPPMTKLHSSLPPRMPSMIRANN